METVLFKEKFLNWPDKSRLIKTEGERKSSKRHASNEDTKLSTDVENNFDAIEMSQWELKDPNTEMEGTFIGRGRSWYDAAERRQYEIDTLSIHFWYVTEKDFIELSEREHGQFYSAGTYVVRWKYKVSLTGRDLKGRPSKHVAVGRERWAYFNWHGSDSIAASQGVSALMTVELDEEKGPQIRVEQGHETAVFLNLWKGHMVVHKGRRGVSQGSNWKLYFVKGECPEEACAIEVDCQFQNLRSRACFILIKGQKAIIWSGQGVPAHKKAVVESLEKGWPQLADVTDLSHEQEGQESETFKAALRAKSEEKFHRELSVPMASTRLYHMTSLSGEFHVEEILCPYLNETVANVMSFNQSDLYKVEQPALFLVEAGNEKLWLWQGWWPDVGHEVTDTNMTTGSGIIRFHAERREAMRTIKEFQRSKFSKLTSQTRPPMELVWAGHEPLEFTNLFPSWTHHLDVETLNYEVSFLKNFKIISFNLIY
jgi:supervillin